MSRSQQLTQIQPIRTIMCGPCNFVQSLQLFRKLDQSSVLSVSSTNHSTPRANVTYAPPNSLPCSGREEAGHVRLKRVTFTYKNNSKRPWKTISRCTNKSRR